MTRAAACDPCHTPAAFPGTRRTVIRTRFSAAALSLALLSLLSAVAAPERGEEPPRNAVTAYGGWFTDNKWTEIAAFDDIGLRDAWMVGVGYTRELVGNRYAALELEGVLVRYFGDQDNWEVDGILMARWRAFPWNDMLPTSVALGVGPSLASEEPAEEVAIDGESDAFLLYWNAEVEVGLPERPWSVVARLHHRSNAYGVLAEDGGSNVLTVGLRYREVPGEGARVVAGRSFSEG